MKKNIENSDIPISRPTMLAPRSVCRRKIENGTSGWRWRSSTATNAASSRTAPAILPSVAEEVHPDVDGVDERVDEQRQAGGHEHRAGDVERRVLPLVTALHEQPRGEEGGEESDRHVDEQHPPPAERGR